MRLVDGKIPPSTSDNNMQIWLMKKRNGVNTRCDAQFLDIGGCEDPQNHAPKQIFGYSPKSVTDSRFDTT